MSRTFALVVATLCVATGCVFESFEQPVEFIPTTNNNNDGGNTTTNNTTTNNVTTPDMGMTTADMGDESDMADMAMTEPWQCPPKVLSMDGAANTEVQIEPLADETFLATWATGLNSAVVARVDIDGQLIGEEQVYESLEDTEQRVELLTDGTDSYHVLLARTANVRRVSCDGGSCSSFTSMLPPAFLLDGGWNGGEEAQYVQAFIVADPDEINDYITGVALSGNNEFSSATAFVGGVAWHSMAMFATPPMPNLRTEFAGALVTSDDILVYRSDTSLQTVETTSCSQEPGNVDKVFAYSPDPEAETLRVIADINDAGQSVVARLDCSTQNATTIADPASMRDWATIVGVGSRPFRTFVVGTDGLQMFQSDGRIVRFLMDDASDFARVDATQNDNGTIAVLTVTETGVVELRTMNESGQCN